MDSGETKEAGYNRPASVMRHVAALLLYLLIALWAMRVVLPAPAGTFPYPVDMGPAKWRLLNVGDQKLTAWGVARNARTILTAPARLFEGEQCYPLANSITLGEHMFGDGLLGTLPYFLTGNPIITYNAVALISLWLGAVAMYSLAYYWTRSAGASFVAGFLFGFHPSRLGDLVHLHVIHNQWIPLALLFADRLFSRRRWRDSLGLTLFVCLQLLGSFYQVLVLAIIGGIYGGYLVCRNLAHLRSLLPKLVFFLGTTCAAGGALFLPYLRTKGLWSVLEGRPPILSKLSDFAFGANAYPGSVLLLFGSIALIGRVLRRKAAESRDPRLVLAVVSVVLLWVATYSIPVPFTGRGLPSLYLLATEAIPGLTAVRAPAIIRDGIYLIGALFAGMGLHQLLGSWRAAKRAVAIGCVTAVALAEVFSPTLARLTFGKSVENTAYLGLPLPGLVELYNKQDPGPVLDLPFSVRPIGFIPWMPHYVFLSAFHHRPVAACYNSYITDVQREIEALGKRLPDPVAADALYALGFRTVILHHELLSTSGHLARIANMPSNRTHMVKSGQSLFHTAFRLQGGGKATAGLEALGAEPTPDLPPQIVSSARDPIGFSFHNRSGAIFAQVAPVEPTPVVVAWRDRSGALVKRQETMALLPLALAPGEQATRQLTVNVPPKPGAYVVSLGPAGQPRLVLALREVRVVRGRPGRSGLTR